MNNPQQIAELIRIQTTLQKISIKKMLKDIGLGVNSLSHMDNGSMPKADNLCKVADYLSVSTDYLLGRTNEPQAVSGHSIKTGDINGNNNSLTDSNNINISKKPTDSISEKFIEIFNNLPFEQQLAVMNFAVEKAKNERK